VDPAGVNAAKSFVGRAPWIVRVQGPKSRLEQFAESLEHDVLLEADAAWEHCHNHAAEHYPDLAPFIDMQWARWRHASGAADFSTRDKTLHLTMGLDGQGFNAHWVSPLDLDVLSAQKHEPTLVRDKDEFVRIFGSPNDPS